MAVPMFQFDNPNELCQVYELLKVNNFRQVRSAESGATNGDLSILWACPRHTLGYTPEVPRIHEQVGRDLSVLWGMSPAYSRVCPQDALGYVPKSFRLMNQ